MLITLLVVSTVLILYSIISLLYKNVDHYPEVNLVKPSIKLDCPIVETIDTDLKTLRDQWIDELRVTIFSKSNMLLTLKNNEILALRYTDLLSCFEWHYKRLRILKRDIYTCQNCSKMDLKLHVHHTYYLKDKLPWEIEDSALLSLCLKCHKEVHEEKQIKTYELIGKKLESTINNVIFCSRCNGAGYFPEFIHINNGICFKCSGNRLDRSLFSDRLIQISVHPNDYKINTLVDECYKFINSIDVEFYKQIKSLIQIGDTSNGSNLLKKEESDDLPF